MKIDPRPYPSSGAPQWAMLSLEFSSPLGIRILHYDLSSRLESALQVDDV